MEAAKVMEIVESKTPILVLSYRNCEIYCCHLDGYQGDTKALLSRMTRIEEIFFSKSLHSQFRIWYNIDENNLDKQTMKLIADSIVRIRQKIIKIAFIGLRGTDKKKFNSILEHSLGEKSIPKEYFTDAESAKEWLI